MTTTASGKAKRYLLTGLALTGCFAHGVRAQSDAGIDAGALIDEYCVACHNFNDYSGGVDLEGMDASTLAEHPEIGEMVISRLRAGLMPPAGEPRPETELAHNWAATIENS